MAEHLADIELRLRSVDQLASVVSAIRGIAAARLREAEARLDGIRAYATTIAEAIGQALVMLADGTAPATLQGPPSGAVLAIGLCSEQGFVGGFNGHVRGEIERLRKGGCLVRLGLVGDRGLASALERGLAVDWSMPMAAHAEEVMALANRLTERLYTELQGGKVDRVLLVHALPGRGAVRTVTRTLVPFDFERFPLPHRNSRPLLTLAPRELLASLAEEYVFAEICEAAMLAFAAESEARMYAMLAARENVESKQGELGALARRLRQEEITAEVIELSSGVEAGRT